MTALPPPDAAAVVSVVMLGDGREGGRVDTGDLRVVSAFDGTVTVTVTVLDDSGTPAGEPVELTGLPLPQAAAAAATDPEAGLIPCTFGDSYSQIGSLTAEEAAFYQCYSPPGVAWAPLVGRTVELAVDIVGVGYVKMVEQRRPT